MNIMTKELIIKLLKEGKINSENAGTSMWGIDLAGEDFTGCDLSGIDFTRANLAGCNFANAKLDNCIFKQANLMSAILNGATATNAWFNNADLAYASCIDAGFEGAHMDFADLSNIDVTNANTNWYGAESADARYIIYNNKEVK